MNAFVPQQLGANLPGLVNLTAAASGTLLISKCSVFSAVEENGFAQLPTTSAADVEIIVVNQSGSDLPVVAAGQINDLGGGEPFVVPDGTSAIFYCFDPPMEPGRQWWVATVSNKFASLIVNGALSAGSMSTGALNVSGQTNLAGLATTGAVAFGGTTTPTVHTGANSAYELQTNGGLQVQFFANDGGGTPFYGIFNHTSNADAISINPNDSDRCTFNATPKFATATTGDSSTLGATTQFVGGAIATAVANKIAGPASAVAGNVAVFNGTTGKIIQDGGFTVSAALKPFVGSVALSGAIATLFTDNETSGRGVYQDIFPGVTFNDNVVGYNTIGSGSTLGQVTGVAGYVRAQVATSGGGQNAVGLFGAATAEANGSAVWGINTLLQDSAARAVGTGTGRILVGYECDINVMNPATEVIGVSVGGNSLAQSTNASGFIVNSLGTGFKWTVGLLTQDGAAGIALDIGLSTPAVAANTPSQPALFQYGDGNGNQQNISITAKGAGAGKTGGVVDYGGTALNSLSLNGTPIAGPLAARMAANNVSAQSIPNNAATVVTGWSVSSDQTGSFNAASGVFTCPNAGAYVVDAAIRFGASMAVNTANQITILQNGATAAEATDFVPGSGPGYSVRCSRLIQCAAGDTLSITAFQSSGGAVVLSNTVDNLLSIYQLPG